MFAALLTPHVKRALLWLAVAIVCAVTGVCFCGIAFGAEAEAPAGEAVQSASDLDYSPLPEHYSVPKIFTKPIGVPPNPKPRPKAIELQFVAPDGQVIHSPRAYPLPMNSSCGPGGCYPRTSPRLFRWRGR